MLIYLDDITKRFNHKRIGDYVLVHNKPSFMVRGISPRDHWLQDAIIHIETNQVVCLSPLGLGIDVLLRTVINDEVNYRYPYSMGTLFNDYGLLSKERGTSLLSIDILNNPQLFYNHTIVLTEELKIKDIINLSTGHLEPPGEVLSVKEWFNL